MGIKLRLRKKKETSKGTDCEELLYTQVGKYWHDKTKALSYLKGRCRSDDVAGIELRNLLQLRG